MNDEIRALAPWFHNVHLPDGIQTSPDHFLGDFPRYKWAELARWLPDDLVGGTVLGVGCIAGFYGIELAKRGAQVTAIDMNEHYLRQASWVADRFGFSEKIRFEQMQVYELCRVEQSFDLVLFLGVFYHLRYPLLGLDAVSRRVGKMMVFQTLTILRRRWRP